VTFPIFGSNSDILHLSCRLDYCLMTRDLHIRDGTFRLTHAFSLSCTSISHVYDSDGYKDAANRILRHFKSFGWPTQELAPFGLPLSTLTTSRSCHDPSQSQHTTSTPRFFGLLLPMSNFWSESNRTPCKLIVTFVYAAL